MKFGVHLPQIGPFATRQSLIAMATAADDLGYDSVWVSDHIVVPFEIASQYPYDEAGVFPAGPDLPWLDPLATLIFVAGVTERVELGTSVLILGYRPPVQTAKLWATLEALSEGRTIMGVGVGWMKEEFDALGMPFDHRGARGDEQLQAYEALFTQERPAFEGRFYRFSGIGFEPKPQRHIPIWVGGDQRPALRRAGRYGDAFYPAFTALDEMAGQYAEVRHFAEAAGRDAASVELTCRVRLSFDSERGDAGALQGGAEQVIDGVGRLAEIGVSHITMDVGARGGGVEAQIEAMQRFSSDVRSKVS